MGIAALALTGMMWVEQRQSDADRITQIERLITAVEKLQSDEPRDHGAKQQPKTENRKARRAADAQARKARAKR